MSTSPAIKLAQTVKFDWDQYNVNKIWEKHQISFREAEEAILNKPRIIAFDEAHSQKEDRFALLGRTDLNKELFVVFTIGNKKIRVISARVQSKKERQTYHEKTKKNTKI